MGHLQLRLLGDPVVQHAGQTVKLPTRKALALLAYLAVAGGMHARESLTALFWPESNTAQGRAALRNTLTYLRDALDDRAAPHLLIEREALGLDTGSDVVLDLQTVRSATTSTRTGPEHVARLQAALDAYRGDFLQGFGLPDCPEFDHWASLQREHWHDQIGQVAERLAADQVATEDVAGAIVTLRRWLVIAPLNEAAYQQLMKLYLALGEREAVRRTYDACRTMLAAEFGSEPLPETTALVKALQAPLRAQPVPVATAEAPRDLAVPLVGRERELLGLIELSSSLRRDGSRVVTLEGEAGIGKSRLAGELLAWMRAQGAEILQGRAFETAGRLPYQPVIEALRERIERENAPDDLVADVWLAELSRLLPELLERYPDLSPPGGDDPATRTRLFEAVARLGAALAGQRSVLLFVDDIQWADPASLDLLHYVARRWTEGRTPILLLCTLRSEALTTPSEHTTWLEGVGRDCRLTRMALHPLTAGDMQELVRRLAAPPGSEMGVRQEGTEAVRFAEWLFKETGGQPFFITETIKALVERGILAVQQRAEGSATLSVSPDLLARPGTGFLAPRVRDVIRARLLALAPAAVTMLAAGAALGQNFTFEQLCQVADLDEREGLAALDDLLARGFVRATQDDAALMDDLEYVFTHDRIRDVAYTEAGDARRRLFHRRALETLERAAAPPAELARHAIAGRQREAAFRYSVAAGDAAMRLFAVRTAIGHYEQARRVATELRGRSEAGSEEELLALLLSLGRAYELDGRLDPARAAYQGALDLARETSQARTEALVLNRLATLVAQSDLDLDQSRTLLEKARHLAQTGGDTAALAETEWNLAQMAVYSSDPSGALSHGTRALTLARELDLTELVARSLNVLALGHSDLGQWRQVEQYAAEATALYALLGNRALEADCLSLVADAQVHTGRTQAGIESGRRALAIAREIETPWGLGTTASHLIVGLLDAGAYSEALELAQEAAGVARAHQLVPLLPWILIRLGAVQRALLDLDGALETHLAAGQADARMPSRPFAQLIHAELSADYALAGQWEASAQHAREAATLREFYSPYLGLTHWHQTEALLRGGDVELARRGAERLGALIDAAGDNNPRFEMPYLRTLATLARWDGKLDAAIAHLEAARALAEDLALPGEQWQILAALGRLYEDAGEVTAAERARSAAADTIEMLAAAIRDTGQQERFVNAALAMLRG